MTMRSQSYQFVEVELWVRGIVVETAARLELGSSIQNIEWMYVI